MIWKCQSCQSEIEIPDGTAMRFCPKCGAKAETEVKDQTVPTTVRDSKCPVCCTEIQEGDETIVCPDCKMVYHKDCWNENNGCATYGCPSAGCLNPPPMKVDVENTSGTDQPQTISSNQGAVRCPQCNTALEPGATFCWSCGADLGASGIGAANVTMFTALRKYGSCKGRACRKEFWLWMLFVFFTMSLAGIIDSVAKTTFFTVIVSLAVFIPNLAVMVRRLQDTGKSGWWILIALVPYIGWFILLLFMVQDSSPGNNEYGPNPKGL